MPTPEELKKIYEELAAMSKFTGEPLIPIYELEDYFQIRENKQKGIEGDLFDDGHAEKIRNQVKSLMLNDLGGADKLGDVFNDIKEANEQEMKQLRETAAQKEKKRMNEMKRQEIRKAKADLQALHDKQVAADEARKGLNPTGKRMPYAPAETRKKSGARGYWNPIRFLLSGMNFGTKEERHQSPDFKAELPGVHFSRDIQHNTPDGKLMGHKYVPENPNGKVVICFGGSGLSAARQSAQFVPDYMKTGATVIQFDYRGFGNSMSTDKDGHIIGTKLSEESMYRDGMEMYKYVRDQMGIAPENIILHGYSMGGPVASRVAADIAEQNQIEDTRLMKTEGKHLNSSMRLGGVVLQSPMPTNYEAAKRVVGLGPLGSVCGFFAWAGGGGFNTQSHMERLYKFDPNIPVHYTGGAPNGKDYWDHDFLSPESTKIYKDPKAPFANSSLSTGQGHHFAGLHDGDQVFINEMVAKGRKANLAGLAQPEKDFVHVENNAPQMNL